jgi:hypothetical protein
MWKNTDPRVDIYKWARIVILRPSLLGFGNMIAGIGEVETKNTWTIFTSFSDRRSYIDADTKWNEDWYWARAPEVRHG